MRQSLYHQSGITLVEWMISITIGMILLAGLTALIARQSSTQAELEKSSRQIENGRYAMQLLNEDVRMAGYYGEFWNVAGLTVPSVLPDPCLTTVADLEPAMAFSIQGYDSPSSGLTGCLADANHVAGTDILVIRRVEPVAMTLANASSGSAGQVYLQSGMTSSGFEFEKKMGTGANTSTAFTLFTKDGTTSAALRKYLVHIYFVSPCSVLATSATTCTSAADGGKPIPTLKMLELSASGTATTMSIIPLVEGIENMQIDYGIDTDGDGVPDGAFVASPAAVAAWSNVMALRVHLLARSIEATAGYVDAKTYALGVYSDGNAQTLTPSGAYKRRLFSQLIRLVNPSSRRSP